jgi:hypothetical protein
MIRIHAIDHTFRPSFVELLKSSVNNVGVKFYNKLPNYLKDLENIGVLKNN